MQNASSPEKAPHSRSRNFAPPKSARLTLPLDRSSVAKGRAFLEQTVRRWGVSINVDDAKLLLTEIVTNAFVHAGTAVHLHVRAEDDALIVKVLDEGKPLPASVLARLPQAALSMDGRGLAIVAKLADRWGVESLPEGNRVWFALNYSPGGAAVTPSQTPPS